MPRRIAHFSAGAASAIAAKISAPDEIWYADTGGEDEDNERFLRDCEVWFGKPVIRQKSKKYASTWELWEKKNFLSSPYGAPCTGELKIKPQKEDERPDDIHIFGYTSDPNDVKRAHQMNASFPDLQTEFPLIDRGLNKAACLAMLYNAGIQPPRVYALGFPNANCIPCVKAQSPRYWALVRHHFPDQFERMAAIEARIGAKLIKIKGERVALLDLPEDQDMTEPLAPACDFLCGLAEQEFSA